MTASPGSTASRYLEIQILYTWLSPAREVLCAIASPSCSSWDPELPCEEESSVTSYETFCLRRSSKSSLHDTRPEQYFQSLVASGQHVGHLHRLSWGTGSVHLLHFATDPSEFGRNQTGLMLVSSRRGHKNASRSTIHQPTFARLPFTGYDFVCEWGNLE